MLKTLIFGPCVIERAGSWLPDIAGQLTEIALEYGPKDLTRVFKASWDKANRSTLDGFRGIGLERGLEALLNVKDRTGLQTTTDIHEPMQAEIFRPVVDVLQIPAFLARQTDLIVAAAKTGLRISIKIPPWAGAKEALAIRQKYMAASFGVVRPYMTDPKVPWMIYRGTSIPDFGTRFRKDTFADMVYDGDLRPLFLDVTHSNGGDKYSSITLALQNAPQVEGLFMEVHPEPSKAMCDSKHQLDYEQFKMILMLLKHQAEQNAV